MRKLGIQDSLKLNKESVKNLEISCLKEKYSATFMVLPEFVHIILEELFFSDTDAFYLFRETLTHSLNVSTTIGNLAKHNKKDDSYICKLMTSALLHDLGKAFIDPSILYKPGQLDSEEKLVVCNHLPEGIAGLYEFLSIFDIDMDYLRLIIDSIEGHHDYSDNGNNFKKFDKETLPEYLKWLRVVDDLDAVSSARSYKEAKGPDEAFKILHKGYLINHLKNSAKQSHNQYTDLVTALDFYDKADEKDNKKLRDYIFEEISNIISGNIELEQYSEIDILTELQIMYNNDPSTIIYYTDAENSTDVAKKCYEYRQEIINELDTPEQDSSDNELTLRPGA